MSEDKKMTQDEELELTVDREDLETEAGYEDDDLDVVILTLDDDTEVECAILDIFPLEDKEYIALLTLDGEERALLYEYIEHEDGDSADLAVIESDEEFDRVAEAFDQILQEAEAADQQDATDPVLNLRQTDEAEQE